MDILARHRGLIGIRKVISVDNPPIQHIIEAGLVPLLVSYLSQEEYRQLKLEAGWALTNILSGTSEQCRVVAEHGAIPLFV